MDIKYLKLIRTIAEEGNISKSADKLYLTQSALSHQLREIEDQLGFKIFLRSRNNWRLTAEGQELYGLAIKVLTDIDQSMHKVQNIRDGSKGTIRMSTECYSFYHGLPAFIQKMGVLYPNINIEMVIEATHHPVPKILSNELDISIVTSRANNRNLEFVELFEDEIFAIIHEEHQLAQKAYVEAPDLSNQHLIIHSYPLETVYVYKHFLEPFNVEPRQITAIPMTEVALEMVVANMGMVCLPKWALNMFHLPTTVTFKPLGSHGLHRTHYLAYRKEDLNKKYIHDFIINIQDEFSVTV